MYGRDLPAETLVVRIRRRQPVSSGQLQSSYSVLAQGSKAKSVEMTIRDVV